MAYFDEKTGEKKYTLKEKYAYFSEKLKSGINSKTKKPLTSVGKFELCAKLSDIRTRMGRNKKSYDYYCGQKKNTKKSGK